MQDTAKFDPTDLDLLVSIIEVIPNLTAVAHAVNLVRKRLKFPIKERKDLFGLFDGKKTLQLGDLKLTVAQVEQFLPEKFFPIESERDLACRLLVAFQIGDIYHSEELMRKAKYDATPAELLPGPAYHRIGYMNLRHSRKEDK